MTLMGNEQLLICLWKISWYSLYNLPNVFAFPDVVNLLLESGVDVDIVGPDSRTALRAAAWAGHADIVRRLLDAGADVNRPDAEGRTPLIAAAYMGCVDIIGILADAGS